MTNRALKDILGVDPLRAKGVREATRALEEEVRSKSGLTGIAVKAGFAVLSSLRPGIVEHLVDRLFDDFLVELDPYFQSAVARGARPGDDLPGRPKEVAQALLRVADRKAGRAAEPVRKAYERLRPSAEKHVESSVPRLAQLLNDLVPVAKQ